MTKSLQLILLFLLVTGGLAWLTWDQYQRFLRTPLEIPSAGYVFQLSPGTTGNDIVEQLAERGFTRRGWQWKLLMRLEPHVYRAGEYRLEPAMRPAELLDHLASGRVVQHRFTVVEGWTFRQLAQALAADTVLEHSLDSAEPYRNPGVLTELELKHPEGWFLPETYQFIRGDSDLDILVRSHAAMQDALQQAWDTRTDGLPLDSPYELLILASIIEKETAIEEERDRIAGVFVRRLEKGMRLQTDPTVIYGLGESFDGDLRRRDLQSDTAYNTYTRHGLPPTPIAMPGKASLMAAARPAAGEALYFVADGKGGHTFSATLEEHQEAVKKLIGKN